MRPFLIIKLPITAGLSMEVLVEDHAKVLIDVLQKELVRVKEKARATDEWFYRLLSVGIVPFLAFLGYCAVNPTYRILMAALPFISILGVLLIGILSNHYLYASYYGGYLEHRINILLRGEELLDSRFGGIFYHGFGSLVFFSYALSLVLLFLVNLAAYPIIDATIKTFYRDHYKTLGRSAYVLEYFWQLTFLFLFVVLAICVVSYVRSVRQARRVTRMIGQ